MTDRIDFGGDPWQAIPKRVLRDARLSARAKGGLVTLLSHEEGWVRSCIAILQKECKVGHKQAQGIMAELRELGYAELVTERSDNRIRKHYVVTALPKGAGSQADLFTSLTSTKPDRHESGPTRNGSVVVEALDVETQDEQPLEALLPSPLSAAPTPFDGFYVSYPRHVGKVDARKAFAQALKRADAATIIAGAVRYSDDPNRLDEFTAHPATWLNRDGWEDDPEPQRSNGKVDKALLIFKRNREVSHGRDTSGGPGRLAAGRVPER